MINKINKKQLLAILTIIFISVSVAGCTDATENDREIVTYTDQMDREVEVVEEVESIVSIAPANTEMLFELGLDDKVVGVTDWCDYPPKVEEEYDSIGGYENPSIETIIDKDPDVVFASGDYKEPVEQLEDKGIPVIVITPNTYTDLLEAIEIIGDVTGVTEDAEKLTNEIDEEINKVKDKVEEQEEKETLYVTWFGDQIFAAGQETYQDNLLNISGAQNVVEQKGHIQVSFEGIIDLNPEVILITEHGGISADKMIEHDKLQGIDAIENEEVHEILEDETTRPSPRVVDGVHSIAGSIHDIELE